MNDYGASSFSRAARPQGLKHVKMILRPHLQNAPPATRPYIVLYQTTACHGVARGVHIKDIRSLGNSRQASATCSFLRLAIEPRVRFHVRCLGHRLHRHAKMILRSQWLLTTVMILYGTSTAARG